MSRQEVKTFETLASKVLPSFSLIALIKRKLHSKNKSSLFCSPNFCWLLNSLINSKHFYLVPLTVDAAFVSLVFAKYASAQQAVHRQSH